MPCEVTVEVDEVGWSPGGEDEVAGGGRVRRRPRGFSVAADARETSVYVLDGGIVDGEGEATTTSG